MMVGEGAEAFVEKALPNGDVYCGGFAGGAPHGKDQHVWRRGKASGKGRFSWPSGATFEGEIRGGRMEGQGVFVGPDGATYRGAWEADQRHGVGAKSYPNGDHYEGQWRRNMQDGLGRYVWAAGTHYVGEWCGGVMSGCGAMIWASGNSYEGMWENGVPSGKGLFTLSDGSRRLVVSERGDYLPAIEVVPQICCNLESEGQAGDITCDFVDELYREAAPAGGGSLSVQLQLQQPVLSLALEVKSNLELSYGHVETPRMSDRVEEETDQGFTGAEGELKGLRVPETFEGKASSSSLSATNDADASSTNKVAVITISPNSNLKRNIKSWARGAFLGAGSFGSVYKGMSDDGAFFAVKEVSLLDQGSKAQPSIGALEQEIALLSQFKHENIVQYYGTDKEESKLYIFIELVTQGSLWSLYQEYNKLQESQVSAYTRQILNGLNYLHERNVIHRDIKCANILVHANGSVKLADFGLAKEMSGINNQKSSYGSVYWMAPEIVNPKKPYGLKADIWSLGCTVVEMLTGNIPYPGLNPVTAYFKIGKGAQPTIPMYLSEQAQDFIGQCVRVDPESRPTASELLAHPFVNTLSFF